MSKMRRVPISILVVCVVVALAACKKSTVRGGSTAPGTQPPPARTEPGKQPAEPARAEPARAEPRNRKLKVGIAIPSYVHAVAWIGQAKGIFGAHGIEAEVTTMGGSAATMKGLVSGDIKIGLAGGDAAIKANLAGADLVVFGSVVTRHYHRLVVAGDIKKPADLKGKTIGLPFLGGPQDFLVQVLCKKWGLKYGKDVKVQNMGKEYARLVAISQGKVHGITSAAAKSKLDKLGLNILANPRTWDERAPYMMMVAQRSFLADNQQLVLDFMRALASAQEFYLRHREESLKVVFDKLGPKKGKPEEVYVEGGPLMYELPPRPNLVAMKLALEYLAGIKDFTAKAGAYDIDRMIDHSLVKKLEGEGAYKKAMEAHQQLARTGSAAKPPENKVTGAGEQTPAKK